MIAEMGNKRNMLPLMSYSSVTQSVTHRLNKVCKGFQAELYGIRMAIDWHQNQCKKAPTCAINVDSKAAILVIANKHTTHPLAVEARRKTIELRKYNSVTLHWVKGHSGLKGNERAGYLDKTVASIERNI
jgi:ribonuclease HI